MNGPWYQRLSACTMPRSNASAMWVVHCQATAATHPTAITTSSRVLVAGIGLGSAEETTRRVKRREVVSTTIAIVADASSIGHHDSIPTAPRS